MRKYFYVMLMILLMFSASSCEQSNKARKRGQNPQQLSIEDIETPRERFPGFYLNTLRHHEGTSPVEMVFTVEHVHDGDTILISNGGEEMKVRLIGYNTPEMDEEDETMKNLAYEARDHLRSLLTGQEVFLELDPVNLGSGHLDRNKRLLAYVHRATDGLFINAHMLEMGYSRKYNKYDFSLMSEFNELADQAREQGRGIWAL